MELKVFKDTLCTVGSLCDVQAELPIETELLIPDYLPQVFKIVKSFVHLVVLQKQVLGNRCTLDGYLRCVVLYQAEENQSLCQTEQKLPFSKTMELPAGEYQGCHLQVAGDVEYINCRAVNQRRVDVRGAYALYVTATAQLEQEVITALAGAGAESRIDTVEGVRNVANLDKLMTVEEEVSFPQAPAAVLDVSGVGHVEEVKIISGKAVVKGQLQLRILYRAEEGYRVESLRKAVPFNQIADLEGLEEGCTCVAAVELAGSTLMAAAGADTAVNVSLTAMLHLRVFRPVACCVVSDAFSTQYKADVRYQLIGVEQLTEQLNQIVEVQVGGALPDENAELVTCFATLLPVELAPTEGELLLRGRGTAHVLCMNSIGEIDCYDKGFEYTLPGRYIGAPENCRVECWATVSGLECRKDGEEMAAHLTLQIGGLVAQRQKITVVESVECAEPLEPEDTSVALYVYYAEPGETVFDIAKRYRVSPAGILTSNHLETPVLEENIRLLVPVGV